MFGAVIGVQGFLSGSFDPLVEDLSETFALIDGPTIPALALGAIVGVPQVAALVMGLRGSPRAPVAAVAGRSRPGRLGGRAVPAGGLVQPPAAGLRRRRRGRGRLRRAVAPLGDRCARPLGLALAEGASIEKASRGRPYQRSTRPCGLHPQPPRDGDRARVALAHDRPDAIVAVVPGPRQARRRGLGGVPASPGVRVQVPAHLDIGRRRALVVRHRAQQDGPDRRSPGHRAERPDPVRPVDQAVPAHDPLVRLGQALQRGRHRPEPLRDLEAAVDVEHHGGLVLVPGADQQPLGDEHDSTLVPQAPRSTAAAPRHNGGHDDRGDPTRTTRS